MKVSKLQPYLVLVLEIWLTAVFGFLMAMVITAWSVRGLTLLFGFSKTNVVNRLDDVAQDDTIPTNELAPIADTGGESRSSEVTFDTNSVGESLHPPLPTADTPRIRGPGIDLPTSGLGASTDILDDFHHIPPPTVAQKTATFITAYIDVLTWSVLWVIGFAIYMVTEYSMPAQLPLNILSYFMAMRIPPSVRRFIHPIFPCAALTILGTFILAVMKRESLDQGHFIK
jgi:uncharacterized membrane protein YjgN (DUF898 family)